MKQIGFKAYILLFIYNFFFKYFVNGDCAPKFTLVDSNPEVCCESVEECKDKGYYYYNSYELKCWKDQCPNSGSDLYYTNEMNSQNKPSEDMSKNTCVKQCSQNFPKYYSTYITGQTNFCLKNCKTDEASTIDNPNICVKETAIDKTEYKFVSEKDEKLYIKECHFEKFIHINEYSKNVCVSNCKEYNQYFAAGNQNCLDKCDKDTHPYYNKYNQCLELCLYNNDTTARYSPQKSSNSVACRSTWSTSECIYESNYTIYQKNNHVFFKNNNMSVCLPNCETILKETSTNSGKYYCNPNCSGLSKRKSIKIPDNSNNYYTVCVASCGTSEVYINGKQECISQCPQNYIKIGSVCYDAYCKGTQKFYNNECTGIPGPNFKYQYNDNLKLYEWVANCNDPNKFIKDVNDKECVSACPQGNDYINGATQDIECLKACSTNFYIDSNTYPGKYECLINCNSYIILVDETSNTRKCSRVENSNFNYIRQNEGSNERYRSCPNENKFYEIIDDKIYCRGNTNPCQNINDKYYFEGRCLTGGDCANKNKLYVENKVCVDECSSTNKYKKWTNNIYKCGTETICDNFIDSGFFCIDVCPEGKNFIGKNNYCKSQCDSTDGEYYYLTNSATSYPIYKCISSCSSITTHTFEGDNTKECFTSCSGNLPYTYNYGGVKRCYANCLSAPFQFTLGNDCKNDCNTANKFYYEKEKKCLSECKPEDFANEITTNRYECIRDCTTVNKKFCKNCLDSGININICVSSCPNEKPFFDGDYCINQCPNEKKFFIKKNTPHIECLVDCKPGVPFYEIYNGFGRSNLYGCIDQCSTNYYGVINDKENKLNAKKCLNSCPIDIYKYEFVVNSETKKQCVVVCPDNAAYHLYGQTKCKSDCKTTENKYREINSTICITEDKCINDYIDFEEKLCLSQDQKCPKERKYITYPSDLNKIICSNNCSYQYNDVDYKYSTPYNTCVSNCANIPEMIHNTTNNFDSDCTCKDLYYINNTIQVKCIPNSANKLCKEVDSIYSISLIDDRIGSKECVNSCNGNRVLSLKEDICYLENYTCDSPDDENTKNITKNNGQRKCDCKYRFFYYEDPVGLNHKIVKNCLDEHTKCHNIGRNRYTPETKECTIDNCPNEFKYEFQNYFCLRACPKDSILDTSTGKNICKCVPPKQYWHKISSGNFECLDTCHDKYPVYAPYNNRCLKQCKDSYFPVFHENKCYRSCNGDKGDPTPNIVNGKLTDEDGGDLYAKTCKCSLSYTWYKHENNTIFCSDQKTDCKSFVNPTRKFKYKIYDTNQCVDECPDEYPYIFNEGCFKNCSHAAQIYNFTNYSGIFECQCTNLWINKTNEDVYIKECINPNLKECYNYSSSLIYKINTTKECVEKCPDEMYEINYTCYENCPEYTKDNERDKKCSCNTNMGYWYEFQREYDGNDLSFLECGVDKCPYDIYDKSQKENPDTRQYLLKSDKKCLNNCSDSEEYKFNYKNICIKECPYYTYTEDGNNCTLFYLNDTNIKNREELKGATEVQALELYYNVTKTINEYKDEFFFNERFDVAIHIYGIDRKNSYKDMVDFTSNKYNGLTYIDFGTCINKLFLDKNISEDEQILLVKYDILNETSYLINRVEYGLFSNNTNEKLDALVCDPYEILVSYPLFLERFNDMVGTDNNNEYLEKFNIGKALYEQDSTINTFDYNSFIYKNFCRGLEYNGKDLVFEDRYKNLYPNNVLLCENNCTINNTDFKNKRVNCLCTYKKDFDFDREEKVDDIFNNPNYYIPTQSPANAEAMKCLFNFTAQQAIAKNFAFYYCFAVAAVEIALALVSSIIGINTITNFIKPILNKIQNKDFRKKSKPKKSIGFKTDNIITSTNRPLNNPPRRNNNYNDDDEEIDSEEVKNNNNNNTISEYDFDSNDNKDANYEINIKKSNNKIPKNDNYYKAEFIPQEYNSKFFKSTDKGVIKKIDRSKLPFKIGKDTRYLVEKRKDIEYESNYLDGQYSPTQNILIITDENNTDITNVVKYIKTEKLSDNKLNNKNDLKAGNNKLFGNLNTNYSKYTDKDLITVKKLKSNLVKPKFEEDGISELFDEDSDDMKVDGDNAGLFTLIRREQLFLRLDYKKYLEKKHPNNLAIVISEILDKIYLVKIILFLRKYDIFTHQLSLYLFCHVLLMSLLCGFFTIRVIKKIWDQDGYPGIGFYLLYGLISNIIIWIIYQIFLYIIDFRDKIKEIVLLQKELKLQESYDYDDNIDERNEKIFKKKYNQIISHIKCIIIIFYVIIFIIIAFCTIYLISFFALYTGTRKKVILSYIYSLIEIIIIKFVYGFTLALLRTASRINKMEKVYKVVYIFDKYIS